MMNFNMGCRSRWLPHTHSIAITATLAATWLALACPPSTATASPAAPFLYQDDSETSEELDTAEHLSKLNRDLKTEIKQLGKRYRAAETSDDRATVVQERRKLELEIVSKAIELIDENKDAAIGLKAITEMAPRVRGKARNLIYDVAIDKFADSDRMTKFVEAVVSSVPTPADHQFMKSLASKSSNHSVQAAATFAQAEQANLVRSLSQTQRATYVERFGDEFGDFFDQWNSDDGEGKLLEILDACETKFGNEKFRGKPIASLAEDMALKMNLVVGKVAPDIVGEDLDGESFKLSDYRGKVVMLDFWGDW